MKRMLPGLFAAAGVFAALIGVASKSSAAPEPKSTVAALLKEARSRTTGTPNVALAPIDSPLFADATLLELRQSGRVPNYLRGVASATGSAQFLSRLVQAALYTGSLSPELKMAMGLRIAEGDRSAYTVAYTSHLMRGTQKGRELLQLIDAAAGTTPPEAAALQFATELGQGPTHLTEATFGLARRHFNDSEIVELVTTTCFFSYFTHLVEGMRLPVESWSLEEPSLDPDIAQWKEPARARIALISDDEIAAVKTLGVPPAIAGSQPPKPANSLGIAIPNSMRAMARNPLMHQAWFSSFRSAGNTVDRAHKLQVSFAVSMVNGCRYCTLHQVLGLRRLGVDPAKLIAMRKDDSALTPTERAAVDFARKLTKTPSELNNDDYQKIVAAFGEKGAFEVLQQTCTFNFMNRFTDGLGLPSEDEAVKTYQEVYGQDAYRNYRTERAASQYGK